LLRHHTRVVPQHMRARRLCHAHTTSARTQTQDLLLLLLLLLLPVLQDEGPRTIKYVDMSKTSDAFDKVREWQETGKKRFP
jgi:hypothetical protein